MAIFFWKGKWWKAQAVKGREQTTKATVPERYQDETQAEVQEFVRLNNAIREERRNGSLERYLPSGQREHEYLIELRQNFYTRKAERRETFRQLFPQHAHLFPPPAAHRPCPPSLELQQQGEKASSLTVQP